ncbi:carbon-nitrogen hydrolase family protein [Burkholderia sp. Bp9015]|uniref:carbon-nitrogen hydrolase family protein n=1 Tax=Burkholderia sp. Bp9015 TaxID=2184563 RepID=UPI000F5B230C|nr:carbon-nitrogen hydrolase family protein [Burkholderia sp. Bp9015]RQR74799.1 carbon-nitrogen hydrolase family protein [Burkholderia sp. Bp9015]
MKSARIAYVQWPDGLLPEGGAWEQIRRVVSAANADLLATNEMPFGTWQPELPEYDAAAAQRWVELHERALDELSRLEVGAAISSRPVSFGDRLANEAFVLERDCYRPVHHKKFFPQEPGFFEESWFVRGMDGFQCVDVGAIRVGVLLCTELFFNEHARAYGKARADVIVAPRASGTSMYRWKAAGALAAIVSGACFVSSNRHGPAPHGQVFGGGGFAVSADGQPIGETSEETTLCVATVDLDATRMQKQEYPCYVRELSQSS